MPVAGQIEPDELKAVLAPWIAAQVGATVRVHDVVVPQGSGFSNETFLFTASWRDDAGDHADELVLRSQAGEHQLFPESDLLTQQYRTMRQLGEHTDLPVARMRWVDHSGEVIGRPFFVMDRLHGEVPADNPPYTVSGFVVDMDPETRRTWHRNAVEAMTAVARVDWRAAGLDYLDLAHYGRLGPEQRRGYLEHYRRFALGDSAHPVVDRVWAWLEERWPDDGEHTGLCWGDARPGNLMFDGTSVVGIFDWEMVSLANPESDLGWWLFLQRYHTDGTGVSLPDGMLDRDETIATWEDRMGRPATHVDFYERIAGLQFCLVMVRLAEAMGAPEMALENPVADLTGELIDAG